MSNYYYILSESSPDHRLYTVGCDDGDGNWRPESDHSNTEDAARRVAFLNGQSDELVNQLIKSEKRNQKLLDALQVIYMNTVSM
jgi:hypothetical protein